MGSKNKLKRFKENETFENVIQPTREEVITNFSHKGKWHSFFGNNNPIVVELGCGKGEYTIALARKNPNKNYIGIDIKGARFWRGAKTAIEENLPNVAFVRTQIELVDYIFAENEVSEIWITFPDPFLKKSKSNRRLTSSWFLSQYKKILPSGAIINLKTDSPELYEFTLEVLETEAEYEIIYQNFDIYKEPLIIPELETKTWYERSHLLDNRLIKFIQIRYQGA